MNRARSMQAEPTARRPAPACAGGSEACCLWRKADRGTRETGRDRGGAASALAACSVDAVTAGPVDDGNDPADDRDRVSGTSAATTAFASVPAYIKASNTGGASGNDYYGDDFGYSVALSADGSTLAVGAYLEDSAATGIDGDQGDNSAGHAGAVYVFVWSGTAWSQQAYLKASNTDPADYFGASVALSADGSTLAVGAFIEDSAATGVDGTQSDNSAGWAGAVYVYTRSGTTWSQEAYVKASNTGADDHFGFSVALSGDGSTLAVGATGEDSTATGIGGDQTDNSANGAGAVYAYR
jgi:hypothetical protein